MASALKILEHLDVLADMPGGELCDIHRLAVWRAGLDEALVTLLFLRPGMILVTTPSKAVLIFVHAEDKVFAAAFQQNALQRVRIGDECEIAFDAVPGHIFKGRIAALSDAIAQGQLQLTGDR